MKIVLIAMAAATSLGSGWAVIHDYSPWAWRSELRLAAGVGCEAALRQKRDFLLLAQRYEEEAKQRKNTILAVQYAQQRAQLEAEYEKLKRDCEILQKGG